MKKISLSAAAVLAIAMTCHTANAAYCLTLGDDSQKPWSDAPDWQRASAVSGVEFHLANPEADDAASHDSWLAQKIADGWVFGEVKDEKKKTHPCIKPFEDLPPEQQFKDALFRAIVHGAVPGLMALEAENGKALKAATVERKPRSEKVRKCGPLKEKISGVALLELLCTEQVEIVASDGKAEVQLFAPVAVSGSEAWDRLSGDRFMLRKPVEVNGGAPGDKEPTIVGFGLFNAGGEQIAWQELPDPIRIGLGSLTRVDRSIIFGG